MVFKTPDEATIKRLTIPKLQNLIESLKERRAEAMAPHNKEIKFYTDLLAKKEEEANAQSSSGVQPTPTL